MAAPTYKMAAPMSKVCKPFRHLNVNPNVPVLAYSSSSGEDTSSTDSDAFPPCPLTPENPCEEIQKAAVKEGDWQIATKFTAFPVRYRRGRGGEPRWEPMTFGEIKELCWTGKDHGRGSLYFNNLVRATFTTHVLTPHDLKQMMTMLQSPTEYTQWERGWNCLLQGFLADCTIDPARAALTMDHLAREGQFTQPEEQAAAVHRQVLNEIKNFARKALVQVPDSSTPNLEYTNIRQEPRETCMKFTDGLKQALEKQISDDKLLRYW
ncbi:uncharacterized protein LOC130265141 [Oenanthe melanoleuca]|uniref:uncharacterized protein LOC130265141 n=1 Tax=Oenanthe melanoleuca TaxID=2939378 RepID=UPI0024C20896|nr:uncharacterized protein LOC130265141 [Oenanthe melanoleuca]